MGARRLALQALLVCCVVVLGVSGSASGALTHSLSSSFTAESFVEGVALDGSGDVYVYDASGSGTVHKYSPSGVPVVFSATGTNAIENVEFNGTGEVAVDDSSGASKGDIYVATGNRVAIYAPTGALLGELNGGIESEVPATQGVWGGPCGVAVGGDGSVYVGLSSGHVFKYVPSANPAVNTDYNSSLNGLESVCNVAVDSSGSVYTSTPGGAVYKYAALQFGVLSATGTMLSELGGSLAVDASNDDVYVDQESQVLQYDSTGTLLTTSNGGEEAIGGSYGLAATNGTVYVADNNRERVDILAPAAIVPDATLGQAKGVTTTSEVLHGTVNPDGVQVTSCRFEYGMGAFTTSVPCTQTPGSGSAPVEVSATTNGLTANTPYQFRLVAENTNGKSVTSSTEFTTPSTPLIESESPRHVGYEGATIEAQINPMGSDTTYHVEYGPDASYGSSVPLSKDAAIGAGNEYVTVEQLLSELQASTTYHFRIVATNAYGTTHGADYVLNVPSVLANAADTCPNAAIRQTQQASLLPECRAYEMVSPVDKAGGNIAAQPRRTQSAVDGNSIKYFSKVAFGDAIGSEDPGAEYIAKRGEEGWSSHAINPEQGSVLFSTLFPSSYLGASPDLSKGVFFGRTPVIGGHPNVEHVSNLYLRNDLQTPGVGHYELLSDSVTPLESPKGEETGQAEITFDWASDDWSRILFETYRDLTAETKGMDPSLPKLYEWHSGKVEFAGVLPANACGTPPCLAAESIGGSGAGLGRAFGGSEGPGFEGHWDKNAISANGSRIVFEAGPLTQTLGEESDSYSAYGDLYMRIDKTTTVQLNASERSTPDPLGYRPARFLAATADDSKVFFETQEELTNDTQPIVNGQPGVGYLYMYEVNAPAGKRLTFIAPAVEGAPMPTISDDGSFVYFIGGEIPGQQAPDNRLGKSLFVWHDGSIRYIAFHLDSNVTGAGPSWGERGSLYPLLQDEFRMSADGVKIAFASTSLSTAQRAGVRNVPLNEGAYGYSLIYVYDYDTDKLTCVSCAPNGELPSSEARFEGKDQASIAGGTQYLSNAMTQDGRYVFFDTGDSLVPQDINGRRDVYEYDTVTNQVHLLSDGRCDCNATFVEASPDGSNVFFTTRQQLVRIDSDSGADLYDARIDGGIPAQNQAPPPPCNGEECRGPASGAPTFSLPSSATFAGEGNPKTVSSKTQTKRKRPTLAQALKACKQKPKRKRAKCRARVRKAYHVNRATVRAPRRAAR